MPGVAAVALGGSWARGEGDALSDVDLGIYYEPPLSVTRLRALAHRLVGRGRPAAVTAPGGWGPWIDGGGWLTIRGRRVDWIYRDLSRVGRVIADARRGRFSSHDQPGHPHGFHTHIYAGEVHDARILHDPRGVLAALQRRTRPYPAALARSVRRSFLWRADFALESSVKPAKRADVFHVSGSLFHSAACLLQILFAANGRYLINEKGALSAAEGLPLRPRRFSRRVRAILARPGGDARALARSLERMSDLVREVEALTAGTSLPRRR